MLQSTDLARLTLLGAPSVHPLEREKVVLAKGKMEIEQDTYSSQLVVWNTSTHTETVLFAVPQEGELPSDQSPRWSPAGDLLAFIRKVGANDELWLYRPSTGDVYALTPKRKVKEFLWAPDGQTIVFTSRENEINTTAYTVKRIRYKLDGEGMTNGYTHLFEVDVETSGVSRITTLESDHGNPAFSADGRSLYYTIDYPDGLDLVKNPQVHVRDRANSSTSVITPNVKSVSALVPLPNGSLLGAGKKHTPNSAEFDQWFQLEPGERESWLQGNVDVPLGYHVIGDSKRTGLNTTVVHHAESGFILFSGTNEGRQSIYRLDTSTSQVTALSLSLNVLAFAVEYCDERGIAVVFVGDAMDQPGELYRAVWEDHNLIQMERITRYNEELQKDVPSVEIQEHFHETPDGLTIQGWTMELTNKDANPRAGTILMIHGGPHLAYGHSFHYDFWYLASRGYRIVFCNPRGSYGYGQAFSYGIVGEWGGKDVQDIIGFLESASASDGSVADEPLYVMGGSYGGYLVNWLIGHDHRFTAAVTERSICNLYSKIGNSDLGFQINLYELGGQSDLWNDEEHIMDRSPIRYAEQVTTPVLILHGEQDHRCPVEQGEQWFMALKRLGKDVEFIRFPGASHAMASSGRPQQRIARLEAVADWFAKNV
ncbi:prolyl oligopeptidase family serine peptidase [Paenibacillus sp. LMG 31456]|uniref:Prolyl oligopeptidase family serine peptidase n=1 Tax=Paenibacillus foliorum TaxID=2654974 RepID=A0A972K1P7_9BACL|nr:S9 family peptidase [Paenibacillus foliorum]NOU95946.1 prolyl oligopeptidase family serine peptidase [Paenibacillus foliorum]